MIIVGYLAMGLATVLVGWFYLKSATGIGFNRGLAALYAVHLILWPVVWAAWTLIFLLRLPARSRP
jgi:hypothetical protein